MKKYIYYKHDNAYFRRKEGEPGVGIRDILKSGKWVDYDSDDLIAPVMFGSRVDESEIESEIAQARTTHGNDQSGGI